MFYFVIELILIYNKVSSTRIELSKFGVQPTNYEFHINLLVVSCLKLDKPSGMCFGQYIWRFQLRPITVAFQSHSGTSGTCLIVAVPLMVRTLEYAVRTNPEVASLTIKATFQSYSKQLQMPITGLG